MLAVCQNSTAGQDICLEAVLLPVLESKYPLYSLSVAEPHHHTEETRFLFGHSYGCGLVRSQIESFAEILIPQAFSEVYGLNIFVGAVIECHAKVPPFFWQMISTSSIVSSID